MAITLFSDGRIEKNGTNLLGGTPSFSAYTSSTYDIPTDTYTKALFQSEHFDSDGAYDTSTSTFTVPSGKGGAYQINAAVSADDINDGTSFFNIKFANSISTDSKYDNVTPDKQSVPMKNIDDGND